MTELLVALVTLTFRNCPGVDNVIFISILSGKLRKEEQKRARRVGLIAAMLRPRAVLDHVDAGSPRRCSM
jgi:predicted tellurium resistance membrane protein TerC